MRRIHALVAATVGATFVTLAATPAGAQQIIDAGKEGDGSGGLAFALMAVMVFLIGFALFFMDRVRRRPGEDDQER